MQTSEHSHFANHEIRLPAALRHYEVNIVHSETNDNHSELINLDGWDTRLSRHVSIRRLKILNEQRDQLLSRARLIASLKHPCFVKTHAIEVDSDFIWIVSEKVAGMPLRDWIAIHCGDEQSVIRHILQLAKALQEAHSVGVAHGQLSASHLLIDQANRIRIDQFRFDLPVLGKGNDVVDRLDRLSEIAYLAPENFRDNQMTSSADMYALGVVLYEMLMGHLPFANLQGLALVASQLQTSSKQWPWSSSLSDAARELMLKLTASEPQVRLNSTQVSDLVRDSLHIDPITGSLDSLSVQFLQQQIKLENLERSPRRRWIMLGGMLVLAVAALMAVKVGYSYWPQLAKMVQPYSESEELEQGIHALSYFYRPEMLERAERHFNQILARKPQHPEAIAGLSIVYYFRYNGDKKDEVWGEKASAAAQQAIKIQPSLPIAKVAHAINLARSQEQIEQAKLMIQQVIEVEPHFLLAHQMYARIFILGRQYEKGIIVIGQSIQQFPDDWYLLQMRGVMQLNRADFSEAVISFRASLSKNPDVSNSYALLSQALDSQDRSQEALEVVQQGLQTRPSALLYNMLGQIKMSKRDYSGAAAAFHKALSPDSGNPQSYNFWLDYGEALMHLEGRHEESRYAMEKALELIKVRAKMLPNDAWVMSIMARIYARLGDVAKARELANQASALSPKNPAARAGLASVFILTNDRSKALHELAMARETGFPEKYIKGDPTFDLLLEKTEQK